MAGIHWKQAATLMLVGKAFKSSQPLKHIVDSRSSRFSSNFNILMMKRSSKSSFFPQNFVFPGGAIDASDFDSRWLEFFGQKEFSELDMIELLRIPKNDIEIYKKNGKLLHNGLPPEMAFRLCAIRETFEETGILLTASESLLPLSTVFPLENSEVESWRKKIRMNSSQFLNLMMYIGKLPPVVNLMDWSDWLTPIHSKKRFDTIFYITCLDTEIPCVSDFSDGQEAEELKVFEARFFLEYYYKGEIILAPPQIYELLKLLNFHSFEGLEDFALRRVQMGLSRWLPVILYASDGALSLLPGDDLYPKELDIFGLNDPLKRSLTLNELDVSCVHHNRFIFPSGKKALVNVKNVSGISNHHINPISSSEFITQFVS